MVPAKLFILVSFGNAACTRTGAVLRVRTEDVAGDSKSVRDVSSHDNKNNL